jgi:glycosyltransferase involved in cell wall biosynthesis
VRVRVGYDLAPELITSAGIGRYARELRLALARRDDVEVIDLLPHRPRRRGTARHRIAQGLVRELAYYGWSLDRQAAAAGADVVHTPAYGPLRCRAPYVMTVHDVLPLVQPRMFPPVIRAHFALTTRPRARAAERVLADSEHGREQLVDVLGLPPERVVAVPLGVDAHFSPGPADREQLGERFGIDRPYVLCVGTLEPRKNLLAALQAVERARIGGEVMLVVAGGQGWRNEAFERAVEATDVRLTVTGRVSDTELAELYRGALCLVFPSLWEGYGLPPLEAMACGCPVIATTRPAVPEVVGDAGLLVDPLDVDAIAGAIRRVTADAELSARLRERGLARAAELTWERTARETAAVYRDVAAARAA